MKILVACESSGVVREAFNSLHGFHAMSCDLLPPDDGRVDFHHQCDVREILDDGWDLMIGHPPCTYLSSSGLHWNKRRPERAAQTDAAIEFVRLLMDAPIEHICIENPVGCISTRIRKPDQIIHPWEFGHPESKTTCLWLKNLPPLFVTDVLQLPACGHWENQTKSGQNKLPPSKDRWKLRAKTYPGIAHAMTDQWSKVLIDERARIGFSQPHET